MQEFGFNFEHITIELPVGISFFTFTQIAFLVDCYYKKAEEKNVIYYTLFVSWFPHLIAGPLLNFKEMMPQLKNIKNYVLQPANFSVGLTYFSIGLFKKVVIADSLGIYADYSFRDEFHPMIIQAWVGLLAYSLQLYFDFSGYTDMAIGISKFFNINLPINFNSPYKSRSIIEFWQKWHMSLTKYIGEYLYSPISMAMHRIAMDKNQITNFIYAVVFPTFVSFLIIGLWHGAGWKFIIFGLIHATFITLNHILRLNSNFKEKNCNAIKITLTFILVSIAWVPFRANSLHNAVNYWNSLIGLNGFESLAEIKVLIPSINNLLFVAYNFRPLAAEHLPSAVILVILGLTLVWVAPNTQNIVTNFKWVSSSKFGGALLGILMGLSIMLINKNSPFLYFQF